MRLRDQTSQEAQRKQARQLRDLKEDFTTVQGKETELLQKKEVLEKQLEVAEVETATVRTDLKLAIKRIEDLQAAINGEIDSESFSDQIDSEDSSDEDSTYSKSPKRSSTSNSSRQASSGANDSTARFEGIEEGDESEA